MKYKKQITTGVLAFALIVSGTTAFALTPIDTSNGQITTTNKEIGKHQKLGKILKSKRPHQLVGTVIVVNGSNFTIELKNMKLNTVDSFEVNTTGDTKFTKDGKASSITDLAVSQKVIVSGQIDTTARTIKATKVKIVTNIPKVIKHDKKMKQFKGTQMRELSPTQ